MKRIIRIFGFSLLILLYGFWQCFRSFSGVMSGGKMVRFILSELGMAASGMAIVIGISALLLCYLCAKLARRSQNTLIFLFTLCRRLLSFMMVAMIIFGGLAFIAIVLSELIWLATTVNLHRSSGKAIIFALCIIGSTLWLLFKSVGALRKCFALFKASASEIDGHNITEQQAPLLWQWIRQLAKQGQVVTPDNIVIGFFDCFYVTANDVRLRNSGEQLKGNTLYFPLTFAAMMSREEIAAVIGHELGHFTGDDTQYSLRFAPLYAGIQNSLDQISRTARGVSWIDRVVLYPALETGLWFLRSFHETVRYWSRIREFAADTAGARTASPEALVSALLRISALDDVINDCLEDVLTGKAKDNDILAGLVASASNLPALDVRPFMEEALTHPTDSHPPTSQRIAALNVTVSERLLNSAARKPDARDHQALMALIASDEGNIVASMAQNLIQRVKQHREALRARLETEAAQPSETKMFWIRTKDTWFFLAIAIILFAAGGFITLTARGGFEYIGWGMVAFSVMFSLLARKHYVDSRKPLYLFSEQGIQCQSVDGIFKWTWMEDAFEFEEMLGSLCIVFRCHSHVPLPEVHRRKSGIRPGKNNTYIITIPDPMFTGESDKRLKIKEQEFIDHFRQYYDSACAREALQEF
ncbi:M48 family metalloprotease [Metakosakonia massiliensis]|uniref:Protease HtpX n=1 Tax=Phytobacter massiliensis TaxID=1485952 RepID=A0A6N3GSU9_9ENTR